MIRSGAQQYQAVQKLWSLTEQELYTEIIAFSDPTVKVTEIMSSGFWTLPVLLAVAFLVKWAKNQTGLNPNTQTFIFHSHHLDWQATNFLYLGVSPSLSGYAGVVGFCFVANFRY